ncbi:MAG TPA: ABC transporter permease [Candidatus Avidesulfovibrio excrementigallinarum]|nr:ABC transporter permease [Candidatus Avidesulfovibrio excrementigallinarum]
MNATASVNAFLVRLGALTRKEFRQLWRDNSNILIGIVLPIILILLFGYAISLDVKHAPIALVMDDDSPLARDVLSGLHGEYLSPRPVPSMREAERLLRNREVDGIVRLPANFAEQLAAGSAQVQLVLYGTDPTSATAIRGYVSSALNLWVLRNSDRGGPAPGVFADSTSTGRVEVLDRLWFNAANSSMWYLVPGLVVIIMTLVGAFMTALVMAREWERGTLESLFVTPVHRTEILLSKIIPYFLVGMIGFFLCLLAARFLFRVPLYGSLAVLLLTSMLYLIVSLALGLVLSALTKKQFLASQLALFATFLPAVMLSGFLFDLRCVPPLVRYVGQILPATYYMELIRTLFLAGNIWPLILKNNCVLLGYAVLFLILAYAGTPKRLFR